MGSYTVYLYCRVACSRWCVCVVLLLFFSRVVITAAVMEYCCCSSLVGAFCTTGTATVRHFLACCCCEAQISHLETPNTELTCSTSAPAAKFPPPSTKYLLAKPH